MDLHLRGRAVIVTGGASGIGAAIAAALVAEGASVTSFDRAAGAPEGTDAHLIDLCDDAACAAAVAARRLGLAGEVVRLRLPGGPLTIRRSPEGRVIMVGPVAD